MWQWPNKWRRRNFKVNEKMRMSKTQGTESKAKLSRRQMMMIAYSRFSGFGSFAIIRKSDEFTLKSKISTEIVIRFWLQGEQSLRPYLGKEYALALEWAEAALDLQPDHFSMTGRPIIPTRRTQNSILDSKPFFLIIIPTIVHGRCYG